MSFVTKDRKRHILLGVCKVGPGYLLIFQVLYWTEMLKCRNIKRNSNNFSSQNLPKRGKIFDVEKMEWLRNECRLDIVSHHR